MDDPNRAPITECLAFDPFAGDFGGAGESDATLSDKMVTARKPHTCSHCARPIARGELHRSLVEIYDGELSQYRWCNACCLTMLPDADVAAFDARRKTDG